MSDTVENQYHNDLTVSIKSFTLGKCKVIKTVKRILDFTKKDIQKSYTSKFKGIVNLTMISSFFIHISTLYTYTNSIY